MNHQQSHYAATVLEFFLDGGAVLEVDLRQPLEKWVPQILRDALGARFAVITASNPHGRVLDAAENQQRAVSLWREVQRLGLNHLRADGRSPDGTHRETGLAIAMDEIQARSWRTNSIRKHSSGLTARPFG